MTRKRLSCGSGRSCRTIGTGQRDYGMCITSTPWRNAAWMAPGCLPSGLKRRWTGFGVVLARNADPLTLHVSPSCCYRPWFLLGSVRSRIYGGYLPCCRITACPMGDFFVKCAETGELCPEELLQSGLLCPTAVCLLSEKGICPWDRAGADELFSGQESAVPAGSTWKLRKMNWEG